MNIKSVYSNRSTIEDVVGDITSQLKGFEVKMLIFFASSFYGTGIGKMMTEAFPGGTVYGCTTAGEISNDKMMKNSVAAMAFNSEMIEDVKVEIVRDIKNDCDIKKAFKGFEDYYGEPISAADTNKYVGIILIDGLSTCEEKIMDRIGDLTNCTFIGGSAGDDAKFVKTYIYAEGEALDNAAILTLIKVKNGFDIIKTQSFTILDKKFTATKVDEASRKVIEFDGKPAVEAYAEALGIPKDKAADYFFTNPVGLVADGEIFVRSPQQAVKDGIIFYCGILEGMEVSLLQSKNIIIDTKQALDNKLKELGSISGIINFHCILRTLELEQKNQTEAYGKIFTGIPNIGFSTYGEEYLGHINQTSTMLVFK
jgi:Uncharacterized conserved protein